MTERDLTGKTILIAGATDGLGQGVAFVLAARGATLLIHGRDQQPWCRCAVREICEVAARTCACRFHLGSWPRSVPWPKGCLSGITEGLLSRLDQHEVAGS